MTADGLAVLQTIFTQGWRFFNSWFIPGTVVTPAGLLFTVLVGVLVLRLINQLLTVDFVNTPDNGDKRSTRGGGFHQSAPD